MAKLPRPEHRKRYGWFRLYNGFFDHPKWRLVAKRSGMRLTLVTSVVLKLLETANKGNPRGSVADFSALECAASLDIDTREVEQVWKVLEDLGWIDREYLTTWDKRQPDKEDPTASERQARRRRRRMEMGLARDFDGGAFFELLIARDGRRCIYCLEADRLEVDHITPVCDGGSDRPDNLGLACRSCNARKAGRTLAQAGMTFAVDSAEKAHQRFLDSVSNGVTHAQTETETSKKDATVTKLATGQIVTAKDVADSGYVPPRQPSLPGLYRPVVAK